MVDQLERAAVAEDKQGAFGALTRLGAEHCCKWLSPAMFTGPKMTNSSEVET